MARQTYSDRLIMPGAARWRRLVRRCAAVCLVAASAVVVGGCQQPQESADRDQPAAGHGEQPPIRQGTVARPDVVPADVNTAGKAAQVVATLPMFDDLWTKREIRLHQALYREALRDRVDDAARPVLLQPMPADELPERLTIDDREFYLRVLAGLHDLNSGVGDVPGGIPGVAWTTVEPAVEAEFFPGSRTLATRLSFEILERNESEATVIAEVRDRTAHVGASQQRVRATWDGRAWQTERVGARVVW